MKRSKLRAWSEYSRPMPARGRGGRSPDRARRGWMRARSKAAWHSDQVRAMSGGCGRGSVRKCPRLGLVARIGRRSHAPRPAGASYGSVFSAHVHVNIRTFAQIIALALVTASASGHDVNEAIGFTMEGETSHLPDHYLDGVAIPRGFSRDEAMACVRAASAAVMHVQRTCGTGGGQVDALPRRGHLDFRQCECWSLSVSNDARRGNGFWCATPWSCTTQQSASP